MPTMRQSVESEERENAQSAFANTFTLHAPTLHEFARAAGRFSGVLPHPHLPGGSPSRLNI